jgi:hypothetical protein
MTTVSELLYESLGPFAEDDTSGDLQKFVAALTSQIELVQELVSEGEDGSAGWSLAFDVNKCPASVLPWLAQWVGVVITAEMSTAQIRAEIAKPTGWERGQEPTIAIAVQRTLTGTQWCSVRPNKPTLGTTYVATLASETPSASRTEKIARAVVPAWMLLSYEAIEGATWTTVEASVKYETFTALEGAFKDFEALEHALPSEL